MPQQHQQRVQNSKFNKSTVYELLTKPTYDSIPKPVQNKNYQKSDPFRGGEVTTQKQQVRQRQDPNKSDLFSGDNFYYGRRGFVPGYKEYTDQLKIQDEKVHVHTRRIEPPAQQEQRRGRRYIPEPVQENYQRPTGRRHVKPIEHVEPVQYAHPHPHYVPSDLFRSMEGVVNNKEAIKNYKFPQNYAQIGENERIWKPKQEHPLWKSHKDVIIGTQYPMDLTEQPVSIDNRVCQINEAQAFEQLKQNNELANKYKQRAYYQTK